MPDTIRRFECPECGRQDLHRGQSRHMNQLLAPLMVPAEWCPGTPIEVTYVAVKNLESEIATNGPLTLDRLRGFSYGA